MTDIKLTDLSLANNVSASDRVYGVVDGVSRAIPAEFFIGKKGDPGDPTEIRVTATHIQWRVQGDEDWIDLIALEDLEGPQGDKGDQGDPGPGLEYDIDGDQIGVRAEGEGSFVYTDPLTGPAGTTDYTQLDNVPTAFPPEDHGHELSEIDIAAAADYFAPSGTSDFAPPWSQFVSAFWVLEDDLTLADPTNIVPGTVRSIWVAGNSATERTISYGPIYRAAGNELPLVSVSNQKAARLILEATPLGDVLITGAEYEI